MRPIEFLEQCIEFYSKYPTLKNAGYLCDESNFFSKFLTKIPSNITREKKSELEGLSFVTIFENYPTNIVKDIKDFSNKFIQEVEYLSINDYFWDENMLSAAGMERKKWIEIKFF